MVFHRRRLLELATLTAVLGVDCTLGGTEGACPSPTNVTSKIGRCAELGKWDKSARGRAQT